MNKLFYFIFYRWMKGEMWIGRVGGIKSRLGANKPKNLLVEIIDICIR